MKVELKILDDGISTIYLPDLDFLSSGQSHKCIEIIKYFANGDEFFFGLYFEDGNFEDYNDTIKYRSILPEYYKNNGCFTELTLDKFKSTKKFDGRICAIGSLPVNDDTFKMIPNVCNYYLETLFFTPKKSWDEFAKIYCNNTMQNSKFFIKNGFADIVFLNVDSGTFCIDFNTDKFDSDSLVKRIKSLTLY